MLKIDLTDVLIMDMDVIEAEVASSVFDSTINLNIYQLDGSTVSVYLKSLWFEYETWNIFLKTLANDSERINTSLSDTYSEFQLKFRTIGDSIELAIIAKKESSLRTFYLQFTKEISKDEFFIFRNAFTDFGKSFPSLLAR